MTSEEVQQLMVNLEVVFSNIHYVFNCLNKVEDMPLSDEQVKNVEYAFQTAEDIEVDVLDCVKTLWAYGATGQDKAKQEVMRTRVEELGV